MKTRLLIIAAATFFCSTSVPMGQDSESRQSLKDRYFKLLDVKMKTYDRNVLYAITDCRFLEEDDLLSLKETWDLIGPAKVYYEKFKTSKEMEAFRACAEALAADQSGLSSFLEETTYSDPIALFVPDYENDGKRLDNLAKKVLPGRIVAEVAATGMFSGNSSKITELINQAQKYGDDFVRKCLNDPYTYKSEDGTKKECFTAVELAAKNGHPNCLEVMLKAKDKEGKPLVTVGIAEKALNKVPSVKKLTLSYRPLEKCKNMLFEFISAQGGFTQPQPTPTQSPTPVPGQ